MKTILALVLGIPAIVIIVCLLTPFIALGLILTGVVSLIVELKSYEKIKPEKILRDIENAIGWKN